MIEAIPSAAMALMCVVVAIYCARKLIDDHRKVTVDNMELSKLVKAMADQQRHADPRRRKRKGR
jgi:hypothetical protein